MSCKSIRVLIAAAFAGVVLSASHGLCAIMLPNGEPDPAHNGNAMQAWLRADSGVTATGGAVSEWLDRSNHGNNATQSTPADQPDHVRGSFGVRNAVDFLGDDGPHLQFSTGFDGAFSGSFTMFILLAPLDGVPSGDRIPFGLVSADGQDRMVLGIDPSGGTSFNHLYKVNGVSANCNVSPMPFADGAQSKFTLITYVNTAGGTHYAYVDGSPTPAATVSGAGVNNADFASGASTAFIGSANDGSGGLFGGANGTYDGEIAEFILYAGALSTDDREAVENYILSYAPPPVLNVDGEPDPDFNGEAMQVWLRADSGVSSTGGAVSEWLDRSNHGNDAAQVTPADQPDHVRGSFGGRNAVDFLGDDGPHLQFSTGFDGAFNGSFTMFILLAPLDGVPSGDRIPFGLVSADGQDRMVLGIDPSGGTSFNHLYKVNGVSANCNVSPMPFADGAQSKFTLITYVNTAGGTHYAYVDGSPTPAATVSGAGVNNADFASGASTAFIGSANNGSGGLFGGANGTYDGEIAEFLVYDYALSAADREAVEDYILSYAPPPILNTDGEPDPDFDGSAMQVWLRANSGVTTEFGAVSEWLDRSNHGNDATQGTAADRPVHASTALLHSAGRWRVVNFAVGGDHLELPTGFDSAFDGDFTMFTLLAPNDGVPSGDRTLFGLVSQDGQDRMVLGLDPSGGTSFNHLYKVDGSSANCNIAPLPFPNGPQSQFTLISYVNTAGGTHYAYVDGSPAAAASVGGGGVNNANFASGSATAFIGSANDGSGNPWPGASTSYDGGIVEFLIYDYALSTADREAVEHYLLYGPPRKGTVVLIR